MCHVLLPMSPNCKSRRSHWRGFYRPSRCIGLTLAMCRVCRMWHLCCCYITKTNLCHLFPSVRLWLSTQSYRFIHLMTCWSEKLCSSTNRFSRTICPTFVNILSSKVFSPKSICMNGLWLYSVESSKTYRSQGASGTFTSLMESSFCSRPQLPCWDYCQSTQMVSGVN